MVPQNGGDKRDRTADLLNAIQALSQLSYTPEYPFCRKPRNQTIKLSKALLKWGYVLVHYALPAELYPHGAETLDFTGFPRYLLLRCEDEIAGCFAGDLLSQVNYTPKQFLLLFASMLRGSFL